MAPLGFGCWLLPPGFFAQRCLFFCSKPTRVIQVKKRRGRKKTNINSHAVYKVAQNSPEPRPNRGRRGARRRSMLVSPAQICGHHGVSFPPSGLGWCPRRAVCAQPRSAPSRTQHPAATAHSGFHLARQRAVPGYPKKPKLDPNSYPKLPKLAGRHSQRPGFSAPPAAGKGLASSGGMLRAQAELGAAQWCRNGVRPPDPHHHWPQSPLGSCGHPASARSPPAAPRHQLAGAAHGAG